MPTRTVTDAAGTWRETYRIVATVDEEGTPITVEVRDSRQLVVESAAFTEEREARRTAAEAAAAKEATIANIIETLGRRAVRFGRNPSTHAADKLTDPQMHRLVGALALALGKVLGEDP